MTKTYLITAGISGLITVILGAIGSHVLKSGLAPEEMYAFNVAVQFQMYHTLALLGMAFADRFIKPSYSRAIYAFFAFGIVFFSLSIYLTSTMSLTHLNLNFMHYFPPFGGISFMLGWLMIFWSGLKSVKSNN
jgi:uncharacterized membrane protein YgdD (TMEM256/DUF423 family)